MTKKKYIVNPRVKQIILGIEADIMLSPSTSNHLFDYLSYYKEENQMAILQKIFSALLRKEWANLPSQYEHDMFKIVVSMVQRDTYWTGTMSDLRERHTFDNMCELYPEIGACRTKTF